MGITINRNEIVSATDFTKKFSEYSKKIKDQKKFFIFKNNQPDMVVLDIDMYEQICNLLDELENKEIAQIIEEREQIDDGTRYSMDDAMKILNEKLLTK